MAMIVEPMSAEALEVQAVSTLAHGSARRQFDVSVVVVLVTLVVAIIASMTQIVSHGPSTAGGYGIDEMPAISTTILTSLRG